MDRIQNAKMAFLLAFSATTVFSADFKAKILHKASEQGLSKITGLLARITDVNSPDKRGRTALHKAAATGNTEMAKVLLQTGANVNSQDSKACTPLDLAANAGHMATMQILLEAKPRQLPHLHRFIRKQDDQMVFYLIALGANVNEGYAAGRTPLHLAALHNNKVVVEALLKAGAETAAQDAVERTALHLALAGDISQETIHLLAQDENRINERDYWGDTPLMLSLKRNAALAVTKCLLQAGADPNIKNMIEMSALSCAIREDCPLGLVELLLKYGASPSREDIKMAIYYNRIDVLLSMANRGTIIPNELFSRILSGKQRSNIRAQMRAYAKTFDKVFDKEEVPRDLQDIIWDMANG